MKYFFSIILTLVIVVCHAQLQRRIDSLKKVLLIPAHDTVHFKIMVNLLNAEKKVDLNEAIKTARKLYKLSVNLSDKFQADAAWYLGMTLYKQGKINESIEMSEKSLNYYIEVNDELSQAQTYNQLANAYILVPDNNKALHYYQLSLVLKEKLGDKDGYSNTLSNIGVIYNNLGNYKKAIEYFEKSAEIKIELNDMEGYATCLVNLPVPLGRIGRSAESIGFLKTALRIADSLDLQHLKSIVLGNLAEAHLRNNNFKEAEAAGLKCLEIQKVIADSSDLCSTYITLAGIEGEQGKYKEAIQYALLAKTVSENMQIKERMYDAYGSLAEGYYKLGDFKLSADYLYKLKAVGDSIYNENNLKSVNEMEAKYQTEKKDAELKLREEKLAHQDLEIKNHQMQRYLFIIGIVLALSVLAFIYRSYQQKKKANLIISEQKNQVEEQRKALETKNKEITDSIYYARRIQRALLPSTYLIDKAFIRLKEKNDKQKS